MSENQIFISYSRRDGNDAASRLDAALRLRGYRPWRDVRELDPSKDFTAELENAIEESSYVLVCLTSDTRRGDSYVRREIGYAQVVERPILLLRFEDVEPQISVINIEWIDFFRNWNTAFDRLVSILTGAEAIPHAYRKPTDDVFRPYLHNLLKRMVAYLDRALISKVDLNMEVSLERFARSDMLAELDRGLVTRVRDHESSNLSQWFSYYGGHVILLGEPGAGKTITLIAHTRDAVAARLADPSQPLPLFGLISTWDTRIEPSFEQWLAEGYSPYLSEIVLRQVISSGNALLLLDGLDELGGEREDSETHEPYDPRLRFIAKIPTSNQILITCRVNDYAVIYQRIPLSGALIIKPVSNDQMRSYLAAQPELWASIQADVGLMEMLRTPLLLSLFTFAYTNMTVEQRKQVINFDKSPAGLRHEIFKQYVLMRYEHERRKLERQKLQMLIPFEPFIELLSKLALRVAMHNMAKYTIDTRFYEWEIYNYCGYQNAGAVSQLAKSLGFLLPDNDQLRFAHLLLQNYFAFQAIEAELQTTNANERAKTLEAIGKMRDERTVPLLIRFLYDGEEIFYWNAGYVCAVAAEALQQIGSAAVVPLIAEIEIATSQVRFWIASIFGYIRDNRSIPALIGILSNGDDEIESEQRNYFDPVREAGRALQKIGQPAVEPLITALSNSSYRVRQRVINVLCEIGDSSAVDPLVKILEENDPEIQKNVITGLAQIPDLRLVAPLIRILSTSIDSHVRACCVSTLGNISDPEWSSSSLSDVRVVDALIQSLQDSEEVIRDAALEALGRIANPRAIDAMLGLVKNPETRIKVAYALHRMDDYRAVKILIEEYENIIQHAVGREDQVRNELNNSLRRVKDVSTISIFTRAMEHKDANLRYFAQWQVEENIKKSSVEFLSKLAFDIQADQWLRFYSIVRLSEIAPSTYADDILNLITNENNTLILIAVAGALGVMKAEKAISSLVKLLTDETTHIAIGNDRLCDVAAYALERIDTTEALAALAEWKNVQK